MLVLRGLSRLPLVLGEAGPGLLSRGEVPWAQGSVGAAGWPGWVGALRLPGT